MALWHFWLFLVINMLFSLENIPFKEREIIVQILQLSFLLLYRALDKVSGNPFPPWVFGFYLGLVSWDNRLQSSHTTTLQVIILYYLYIKRIQYLPGLIILLPLLKNNYLLVSWKYRLSFILASTCTLFSCWIINFQEASVWCTEPGYIMSSPYPHRTPFYPQAQLRNLTALPAWSKPSSDI